MINLEQRHSKWMGFAFSQAQKAYDSNEVPVGAVVVYNDKIIGRGHNQKEQLNDPTAHAEIIAITAATNTINDWRLIDCELYVTKEPCPMCAGALLQARVKRVVYGAKDLRWGALTKTNMLDEGCFNHHLECVYIPYKPAELLLKHFFAVRRKKQH